MSKTPLVSVVMPVHNGAVFIKEAVESILAQTYKHFEFIIVDDGSTDHTVECIRQFDDARIRLVSLPAKAGLVTALNTGVSHSAGSYIARMDADDKALPLRLEKQVSFMEQYQEIGACGTAYREMNGRIKNKPLTHEEILFHLFNASPFLHPSVMIRKAMLDKLEIGYEEPFKYASEDLALWMKLCRVTRLANLPDVLMEYRVHHATHMRTKEEIGTHNYLLKKAHIEWMFPHVKNSDELATYLNRIKPYLHDKDTFRQMLLAYDRWLKEAGEHALMLASALSSSVWFHLASNAPRSAIWLMYTLRYEWISLSTEQHLWLLAKPLLQKVRSER